MHPNKKEVEKSASFFYGHITTQPHNHTTTQPHNHTTTQPHNHTTTQPHNHKTARACVRASRVRACGIPLARWRNADTLPKSSVARNAPRGAYHQLVWGRRKRGRGAKRGNPRRWGVSPTHHANKVLV
nr:hypothetical protein HKQZZDGK_HKQZZDGK_CDS_0003 [Microvirus sp.]CAI9752382.1 hypothetical protein RTDJWYLK_RTDJWYLK_CDS_0003 [Microvirus sp.]